MNLDYSVIKHVCIYGAGGVGGYFGCRIAEAVNLQPSNGFEVYFIARGAHLQAVQERGITVKTPERTISARPILATDDVRQIPVPDLVLLCVKSYDLDSAVASLDPVIHKHTVILPLLNGIDVIDRIRKITKKGIVLPACVYLGTHIESPGVISQSGGNGVIIFGPDRKFPDYSAENVKAFFNETGILFSWYEDPYPPIWEKYIFIAAFGLVTTFTGQSLGAVTESTQHSRLVRSIMEEIYAVSRVKGINLAPDIVEKSLARASNFPYEARTSFQRDIEKKGSQNEGDLYGGAILREGSASGVPTPVTESVYQQIQNRTG
jgi:2-dehydropantoate 2-reductase